ncbi:MAG: hypothetical protein AABZ06_00465 [Bdellovibrionota bacterium]
MNNHFLLAISTITTLVALFSNSCSTGHQAARHLSSEEEAIIEENDDEGEDEEVLLETRTKISLRGSPAEYDPGPPIDSKWPDLFADVLNYRAYGKDFFGGSRDKFRWSFGPMFYRGRLTPDSVKVFIVGQEGAQDENVSNRSFTGSTGTKMQNFLNAIGINKSYLFMNTFVYTINGQYGAKDGPDKKIVVIAQNENSTIVQQRHRMFDYMLETNKDSLALIIGVGTAGKDSVVTWVKSHGGKCEKITECDATVLGKKVKVIGLVHPGGASGRNGGNAQGANIKVDFNNKFSLVSDWLEDDQNWLLADSDAAPKNERKFSYKDAPIPHRDFAFGTPWRMGREGTSSNRKDRYPSSEYRSIQVYSDDGCYNGTQKNEKGKCLRDKSIKAEEGGKLDEIAPREPLEYKTPADLTSSVPEMASEDVAWESPKSQEGRRQFDPGPGTFSKVLTGQLQGYAWPDFNSLGVTSHPSWGNTQIYRGRLDLARVLILADQESNDDIFSGRALTGSGGQRLQSFLNAIGINTYYGIVRTLPVDTMDLDTSKVISIATNPEVSKVRGKIFETILAQKDTQLILAVGPVAKAAMGSIKTSLPVVYLDFPDDAKQHVKQWQGTIQQIKKLGLKPDSGAKASWKYDGKTTSIPRFDLPNQTRWWIGVSGTRSARPFNKKTKQWDPNYYKVYAPDWVMKAQPKPLSDAEKDTLKILKNF